MAEKLERKKTTPRSTITRVVTRSGFYGGLSLVIQVA
jgi:hypothetical protein